VLLSGVQGITNLITTPGLINLDFADVKSVMSGAGSALMGIGSSRGEGRAVQAAGKAINSPLLEASMDGAQGVLLSIAGGSDLGLFEINEAASLVQEAAHPEANIIFGTVIDDSLGDEVRVTVIAAGFEAGGPTHKKLEPTAFRSADKPAGDGAGSSSGSAQTSAPDPPRSDPPAGHPTGPTQTTPPSSNGAGYGTGFPSNGHAAARAAGNGNPGHQPAHQAGTLPPSAPGLGEPYAPPPQRRTDQPQHGDPAGDGSGLAQHPVQPMVAERPAPAFTRPVETHDDLDDDVDVPPFMKR
jgi:cell division protein FtsZ